MFQVRYRVSSVLLVLLLGCGSNYEDASQVCVGDFGQEEVVLTTSEPIPLSSRFSRGACTEVPKHFCNVAVNGQTIDVTTEARVRVQPHFTCIEIAVPSVAECQLPELEAGTYTLRYAGEQIPLEIPSTGPRSCLGDHQLLPR